MFFVINTSAQASALDIFVGVFHVCYISSASWHVYIFFSLLRPLHVRNVINTPTRSLWILCTFSLRNRLERFQTMSVAADSDISSSHVHVWKQLDLHMLSVSLATLHVSMIISSLTYQTLLVDSAENFLLTVDSHFLSHHWLYRGPLRVADNEQFPGHFPDFHRAIYSKVSHWTWFITLKVISLLGIFRRFYSIVYSALPHRSTLTAGGCPQPGP